MKESRTDRVYKLIEQRGNKLLGRMDVELKGTKLYGQEPQSPQQRLNAFDKMTEADKMQLISQYGLGSWLQLADEMDNLRRRSGGM